MQHSCSHHNACWSITCLTCMSPCTWQQNVTPIMQRFQCDLQPHPKHPITIHTHTHKRIQKQLQATVAVREQKKSNRTARNRRTHTSYLSSPPAATFHGKTQGFVLRLPLQPKSHATFMQPLHSVLHYHVSNPHVSTHGNKTRHQSCSHFIAICNHRFQNTR